MTAARYHDTLVADWENGAATPAYHYRRLGIALWVENGMQAAA
ncbi:MAG: hypothetical protein M0002_18940 [Rhodospirillales bacterium]|nr:hypothetical protein [Rhodospirillales bacterium]